MPELPEVETIVRDLARPLTGATIDRFDLRRRDMLRAGENLLRSLTGARILRILRQGKRIVIETMPADSTDANRPLGPCSATRIVIHLGMSGRLSMSPSAAPLEPHTHVRVSLGGREDELRFRDPRRFGGVWLFGAKDAEGAAPDVGALGPDALTISTQTLQGILQTRRQIKAVLLDQRRIAGLGNIYADEALFRAGIHPLTPASHLDPAKIAELARAIRAVLQAALNFGGTTLIDYRRPDGQAGSYAAHHRVYGREGKPCTRCGSRIVRRVVAGRSSHVCLNCQPLVRMNRRTARTRS